MAWVLPIELYLQHVVQPMEPPPTKLGEEERRAVQELMLAVVLALVQRWPRSQPLSQP
jgi:hypothetical protein